MPVPWEAFIPMGLVVVMFGVTGTGFNVAKRMTNDGKVRRCHCLASIRLVHSPTLSCLDSPNVEALTSGIT